MSDKQQDKQPPLERYFRILEVLSGFADGLSLTELTTILMLPKGSTHRLLSTMQKSQLIVVNAATGMYMLGDRVRRLAQLSAADGFIEALTASFLQRLVADTGETCYIARLEGTAVRVVAMESPNAPWRGFVLPGKVMHPHATACAKAILAFQPADLIRQALATDLPALTRHTLTLPQDILAELQTVRQQGYATCIGEIDEGLAAAAVPVSVTLAGVIYAVGIVGPLPRIRELIDHDIIATLKSVAHSISVFLSKAGKQ